MDYFVSTRQFASADVLFMYIWYISNLRSVRVEHKRLRVLYEAKNIVLRLFTFCVQMNKSEMLLHRPMFLEKNINLEYWIGQENIGSPFLYFLYYNEQIEMASTPDAILYFIDEDS